jgi:Cu/Ag efflux protein CusF
MRQQHSLCPTLILAAVLVLPVCASAQVGAPPPAAVPADALPGHFAEAWQTSTSEVMAVDAKKRLITLREEGEEPELYSVDKDVRNLDQVKVGDRVKVNQYMATSIKILPKGELGEKEAAAIERSKPGDRPGGVAVRTRTRIERISSIFPNELEFLTRNEKGKLTTWKVKDAKDLEKLKSGDRLQLTSMTALAVKVTPAPTTTTAPTTGPAGATTAPAAPVTPAPAAPSAAPGS